MLDDDGNLHWGGCTVYISVMAVDSALVTIACVPIQISDTGKKARRITQFRCPTDIQSPGLIIQLDVQLNAYWIAPASQLPWPAAPSLVLLLPTL